MNDTTSPAPVAVDAAIAQLYVSLDTLVNNMPIHRDEGNHEQANLCARNIPQLRKAIKILEAAR